MEGWILSVITGCPQGESWLLINSPSYSFQLSTNGDTFALSSTDDDCERRLQRLREVAAIKTGDLTKYASSSRSCEADDEFDEEEGAEDETDPAAHEDEDEDEEDEDEEDEDEAN